MNIRVGLNQIVPQTCGVGVVGIFRQDNQWDPAPPGARLESFVPTGGCGWLMASFTDNPAHVEEYREAYKQLKKRFTEVYKSPVRVNKRTGHKFFFCIFDTRG